MKSDDVACRKNKIVPYNELYKLKGVPFHSPEGVQYYVDRKRKIEKLNKQQERKRMMCDKRHHKSDKKRMRDSGRRGDDVGKKK